MTAVIGLMVEGIKLIREMPSQSPVAMSTEPITSFATPISVSNNPPVAFFNEWVNIDTQSGSITRISIQAKDGETYINMFGSCSPTDCDFRQASPNPEVNYNPETKTLNVKWVTSFDIMTQELILTPDGRLKLTTHDHFTDNSGRLDFDFVDYFTRQ